MFTFFLLSYAGIVMCSVMQSMIRTVICSVFLFRFLQRFDRPKMAKALFVIYLFSILSFDLYLAYNIFTVNGEDCTPNTDWQILSLISVDTIQSLILLSTTLAMRSQRKKLDNEQSVLLSSSSREKGPMDRMFVQMKLLAGFYFLCAFFDWAVYYSGRVAN